jgi:hypothetical protein
MTGTEPVRTAPPAGRRSGLARLRFRLRAERDIHELTRDRDHEESVRAEAAVRLAPGAWSLADLFRRHR